MMITDIEDYFEKGCGRCDRFDTPNCSTKKWNEGLLQLRKICLSVGLNETVKWGQPCYMFAGRNIVIMGALINDFRLGFFNPGLMQDPENLLEKNGKNTANKDTFRFTENKQVNDLEPFIKAYLLEAMEYAEKGIKQDKKEIELDMPEELIDALDNDNQLAEAFFALTKGRQKSYVININSAKKSETRINRIIKFRDKIFAGKGANEY